jgi:hypothetical protein
LHPALKGATPPTKINGFAETELIFLSKMGVYAETLAAVFTVILMKLLSFL